tara:strand:+ start:12394 stop:13689 length:1296 start_codon:yes stop_codon:yes gene_type:complete
MKIRIPNNNTVERKYIIDILLGEFLGLQYSIEYVNSIDYEMILSNGNKLVVRDAFFNNSLADLSYLQATNIPAKVCYSHNQFLLEKDIPIIYGSGKLDISENEIICGIDIFASSFFMLTRWEEYVNTTRDEHDRFPALESLAFKNDFLHRPLVNEYVEMLWNMLLHLGFKEKRIEKKYELVLSHDIDFLFRGKVRWCYDILRDFKTKFNIKHTLCNIADFFSGNDPYDTFDYLMTVSENAPVKSHFYFMADNQSNYGTKFYLNNKPFLSIVNDIKKRGHVIGFHPGYKTYQNPEIWCAEKLLLENKLGFPVDEGRQHFLMMNIPKTLKIWDDANMKVDSSLGYADKNGFRCGTGDEFSLFDFRRREMLRLKERPLVVMDVTLFSLGEVGEMTTEVLNLMGVCRKYKMKFTVLFHNSSMREEHKVIYSNLFS